MVGCLRYMHSTGASAFFVVVYLHMFRGLIYGSYQKPRELLWVFGMLIFLVLMAEAFMGYLLPWGQMSYWGAQVIISLFGAIPVIGDDLTLWIRGDYVISGATLNRFFALHVIALANRTICCLLCFTSWHCTKWVLTTQTVSKLSCQKARWAKTTKLSSQFHEHYTKKYDIIDWLPFHPYGTVKDLDWCSAVPILVLLRDCSLTQKWAVTSLSHLTLKRLTR